ncbi:uncharacterized protein C2orf16-like isoform X2 [Antechinus flavipes]|nr:uncharacterized protein C2orf16-like isoform X2 [Antechinus flavipes]
MNLSTSSQVTSTPSSSSSTTGPRDLQTLTCYECHSPEFSRVQSSSLHTNLSATQSLAYIFRESLEHRSHSLPNPSKNYSGQARIQSLPPFLLSQDKKDTTENMSLDNSAYNSPDEQGLCETQAVEDKNDSWVPKEIRNSLDLHIRKKLAQRLAPPPIFRTIKLSISPYPLASSPMRDKKTTKKKGGNRVLKVSNSPSSNLRGRPRLPCWAPIKLSRSARWVLEGHMAWKVCTLRAQRIPAAVKQSWAILNCVIKVQNEDHKPGNSKIPVPMYLLKNTVQDNKKPPEVLYPLLPTDVENDHTRPTTPKLFKADSQPQTTPPPDTQDTSCSEVVVIPGEATFLPEDVKKRLELCIKKKVNSLLKKATRQQKDTVKKDEELSIRLKFQAVDTMKLLQTVESVSLGPGPQVSDFKGLVPESSDQVIDFWKLNSGPQVQEFQIQETNDVELTPVVQKQNVDFLKIKDSSSEVQDMDSVTTSVPEKYDADSMELTPGSPVQDVDSTGSIPEPQIKNVDSGGLIPGSQVKLTDSKKLVKGSQVKLTDSEGLTLWSQVKLTDSEGLIPWSQVKLKDSKELILESQVKLTDSKGLIPGSQVKLMDSKGLIPGSQVKLMDSKGLIPGSQVKLTDSNGLISGSQARLSDSKKLIPGSQVRLTDSKVLIPGSQARLTDSKGLIPGSQVKLRDSNGLISGVQARLTDTKGLIPGSQVKLTDSKGLIPWSQVKLTDSRGPIAEPQVKLTDSKELISGSQVQFTDTKSLISGSQIKLSDSKELILGTQVIFTDSKGLISGSQVKLTDSEGLIPESQVRLTDSNGLIPGSQVKLIDSNGLIPGSQVKLKDSKGLISWSQVKLTDSKGLIVESQVKLTDSKGLISGSQVKLTDSKGLILGSLIPESQVKLKDSKGLISGSQVKLSVSKGLTPESQVKLTDSKGLISGSQVRLSDSKGLIPGSQVKLKESKGLIPGTQVKLTDFKGLMAGSHVKLIDSEELIQGSQVKLTDSKGVIPGSQVKFTDSKGLILGSLIPGSQVKLTDSKGLMLESQVKFTDSEGLIQGSQVKLTDSKGLMLESQVKLTDSEGLIQGSQVKLTDSKGLIPGSQVKFTDSKGLIPGSLIPGSQVKLINSKGLMLESQVKLTDSEGLIQVSQVKLTDSKGLIPGSQVKFTDSEGLIQGSQVKLTDSKGLIPGSLISGSQVKLTNSKGLMLGSQVKLSDSEGLIQGSQVKLTASKGLIPGSQIKFTDSEGLIQGSQVKLTDSKGLIPDSQVKFTDSKRLIPGSLISGSQVKLTNSKGLMLESQVKLTDSEGLIQGSQVKLTDSKGLIPGSQVKFTDSKELIPGSLISGSQVKLTNSKGLILGSQVKLTDSEGLIQVAQVKLTDSKGLIPGSQVKFTDSKGLIPGSLISGSQVKLTNSKELILGSQVKLTDSEGLIQVAQVKLTDSKGLIPGSQVKFTDSKGLIPGSLISGSQVKLTNSKELMLGSQVKLTDSEGLIQVAQVKLTDSKGLIPDSQVKFTDSKGLIPGSLISRSQVKLTNSKGLMLESQVKLTDSEGLIQVSQVKLTDSKGLISGSEVKLTNSKGLILKPKDQVIDSVELTPWPRIQGVDSVELTSKSEIPVTDPKQLTLKLQSPVDFLQGSIPLYISESGRMTVNLKQGLHASKAREILRTMVRDLNGSILLQKSFTFRISSKFPNTAQSSTLPRVLAGQPSHSLHQWRLSPQSLFQAPIFSFRRSDQSFNQEGLRTPIALKWPVSGRQVKARKQRISKGRVTRRKSSSTSMLRKNLWAKMQQAHHVQADQNQRPSQVASPHAPNQHFSPSRQTMVSEGWQEKIMGTPPGTSLSNDIQKDTLCQLCRKNLSFNDHTLCQLCRKKLPFNEQLENFKSTSQDYPNLTTKGAQDSNKPVERRKEMEQISSDIRVLPQSTSPQLPSSHKIPSTENTASVEQKEKPGISSQVRTSKPLSVTPPHEQTQLLQDLQLKITQQLLKNQLSPHFTPSLTKGMFLQYPICLQCGRCSGPSCPHKFHDTSGPWLLIYPQLRLFRNSEGHGEFRVQLGFKLRNRTQIPKQQREIGSLVPMGHVSSQPDTLDKRKSKVCTCHVTKKNLILSPYPKTNLGHQPFQTLESSQTSGPIQIHIKRNLPSRRVEVTKAKCEEPDHYNFIKIHSLLNTDSKGYWAKGVKRILNSEQMKSPKEIRTTTHKIQRVSRQSIPKDRERHSGRRTMEVQKEAPPGRHSEESTGFMQWLCLGIKKALGIACPPKTSLQQMQAPWESPSSQQGSVSSEQSHVQQDSKNVGKQWVKSLKTTCLTTKMERKKPEKDDKKRQRFTLLPRVPKNIKVNQSRLYFKSTYKSTSSHSSTSPVPESNTISHSKSSHQKTSPGQEKSGGGALNSNKTKNSQEHQVIPGGPMSKQKIQQQDAGGDRTGKVSWKDTYSLKGRFGSSP